MINKEDDMHHEHMMQQGIDKDHEEMTHDSNRGMSEWYTSEHLNSSFKTVQVNEIKEY